MHWELMWLSYPIYTGFPLTTFCAISWAHLVVSTISSYSSPSLNTCNIDVEQMVMKNLITVRMLNVYFYQIIME
jgi:hypothetical protein